jgi:enoyl-CoA hydratase/carnithine racemase
VTSVQPEEFAHIQYAVNDGVALVTLNRPERRNAWGGTMSVEYRWALHHAHTDDAVRVVVLTGAGDAFCAGADTGLLEDIGAAGGAYTKEKAELPPFPDDAPVQLRHNHTVPLAISTPLIAAINGACAGAGFVLATYADLRWAAESARFGTAFAALGLPAEYGIGWMLPRITGNANALDLLYDPVPRSAREVERLGFVQRVLPDEALLSDVLAFAARLARHSSADSLRTMKRGVWVDAVGDLDEAYRRSVADMEAALGRPDFRTGIAAAKAKTRPDFLTRG